MKQLNLHIGLISEAEFSPCRTWRYSLSRIWDRSLDTLVFIGLNPSTADENKDDPTIRRCLRFGVDLGFGSICMINLFAFRATKPEDMKTTSDPIGPGNDLIIERIKRESNMIIASWGVHGEYRGRNKEVLHLLSGRTVYCLGKTKAGHPRHPLYIRADKKPEVFAEGPLDGERNLTTPASRLGEKPLDHPQ